MFNKIKKTSLICTLCLTTIFSAANVGYGASHSKKAQVAQTAEIDYDTFSINILEKNEVDFAVCHEGKKRGLNIYSKDGNYDVKLFFKEPVRMVTSKWLKNKVFLPNENVVSAQIFDFDEKFEIIDEFSSSDLYETEDSRNYVLVSKGADYRIDIITDKQGNFTTLSVTHLIGEEGVYSYLNFMKLIAKKMNEKT